ncbi:BatA domain-containing protein [Hymenobacter busanensis]|nr:BatA domain-containing protein [Hymenobacter busanensis]QHJ09452.1 hypothetical protein GUY19_20085 [Hymenobacter busanensis]
MILTYPWALLTGLLVIIPIALHLFELRRPQKILFTNLQFIREVKLVTARQRRLQHLLVLLFRCLFVIGLVLCFCQPIIPVEDTRKISSNGLNVIVDASASMQVGASVDETAWDAVLANATRLPEIFPAARYELFSTATPRAVGGAEYIEKLNQLAVGGREELSSSLARLRQQLIHNKRETTFIFSDFQRSDFSASEIEYLNGVGDVYLVAAGNKPVANVYVDSVSLGDEVVRVGDELHLTINLRNGGALNASKCGVRVLVGKTQVFSSTVDIPANSGLTTEAKINVPNADTQLCKVELVDDAVAFDNDFYFTLQPAAKVGILDIVDKQSALRNAYSNEPSFTYSNNPSSSVRGVSQKNFDLVFLQEAKSISSYLRADLVAFVRNGGKLVIIPSSDVKSKDNYQRLFADLGLSSIRFRQGAEPKELRELAAPSSQNPFFQNVFAEQTRRPDMPKAAPVLTWSRATSDVLSFREGDAFLSGFSSGAGMVYVFAAPLSGGYSTLLDNPLFVPVMYRLAAMSSLATQAPAYRLTARAIDVLAVKARGAEEAVYKLVGDTATYVPTQQIRAGRLVLQVPPAMRKPGFYTLTLDDKPVTTLAFNLDKRESELACYSVAELQQLAAKHSNIHVYDARNPQAISTGLCETSMGTTLWRYCLLLALLGLLGEVLTLRFGRRAAAVPAHAVAA